MNLSFSEEQNLFAEAVTRFLDNAYDFERRRRLVAARAWGDPVIYAQFAELGCFGLAIPETAGGFGGDAVSVGLLARALGRHLVIEPVIPSIVAGALLSGAHDAGDIIAAVIAGTTRLAVADGLSADGERVSGTARSVPGGAAADAFTVAAEDGLLIVHAADIFLTPVPMLDDTPAADIMADRAPATRLAVGDDWIAVRARAEALGLLAAIWQALGSLEAATDATAAYMRERRQFGRPLGDFQVVQHRIAEMIVAAKEAEAAALLAAMTVDADEDGGQATRALATATARTAIAAGFVADHAVQLHGGMGVSDELDIAARFRQLQAFRLQADAVFRPADHYAESVVANAAHHRSAVLA